MAGLAASLSTSGTTSGNIVLVKFGDFGPEELKAVPTS